MLESETYWDEVNMIYMALAFLALIILLLTAYILLLRNKLKQVNRNLKELIKENDNQQSNPQSTSGDIYFKVDKDFNITFINESGADVLGYLPQNLLGQPVFGTLMEDKLAQREALGAALSKMNKHQSTINTRTVLLKNGGQKQLMLCRERPILNEILECEGISFLCKDISEAEAWKENLSQFQERDIFTNTLNEATLLDRFEHDFQLAKRYNRQFSCVVVELRDIYEFISKGIDFETADKMLKVVSDVCFANLTPSANIGRVDKTKIFMILNGAEHEKARAIAFKIFEEAVPAIQKLRVDKYNAQMMVITYTNRRNFSDTYDGMLARIRRHIKTSLKHREYGVVSSDDRGNIIEQQ